MFWKFKFSFDVDILALFMAGQLFRLFYPKNQSFGHTDSLTK